MNNIQWNYRENSTTFDGSTSWFKYEEIIDDWLDLTQLEARKCGLALKNRCVGDAAMYKGLLDQETLRSEDGVKYFKNTLRLTLSKELQVFSSADFFNLFVQGEETLRLSSGLASFHCSMVAELPASTQKILS